MNYNQTEEARKITEAASKLEARKITEAISKLESCLKDPERLRLQELIAKTKKLELDYYIKAGFSREEAMQLILQEPS